jgi:transposase
MQLTFIPAPGFSDLQLTARVPITDLVEEIQVPTEPIAVVPADASRLPIERNQEESANVPQNVLATPFNLFGEPDVTDTQPIPPPSCVGRAPRLRLARRDQITMRTGSLDQWLPVDHEVRQVWAYVLGLNLDSLLDSIQAVEGVAGRDATDPRILVSLWLYATSAGIGSARELDKLCKDCLPYEWICGGVSLNYHTLADFRVAYGECLDQLLTESVAVLMSEEVIDLKRVAQDGMRVRASAGASSFRREETLKRCLEEAKAQVETLKKEVNEDSSASTRRQKAARERAARERQERVEEALRERTKLEELREKQKREKGIKYEAEKLRASTTEPEARVIKMADGGTRPGYNMQFATTTAGRVIVGVDVTNSGGDGGQMLPMVEQLDQRYGQTPNEYLVDGGFATKEDIEQAKDKYGVDVYAPIKNEKKQKEEGMNPYQPKPRDTPAIGQWRQRMGTADAKEIYKQRASTAEWVHAGMRNNGLYQLVVRGLAKAKCIALWHALTHNLWRYYALKNAQQAGGDEKPVATA